MSISASDLRAKFTAKCTEPQKTAEKPHGESLAPRQTSAVQRTSSQSPQPAPRNRGASSKPSEKEPPHSIEAEKGVLGSMLLDAGNAIPEAHRAIGKAKYFNNPVHAEIYSVMVELWQQEKPVDLVTLTESLISREMLQKVGGPGYITDLFRFVPTASNLSFYIDILREKYVQRSIMGMAGNLLKRVHTSEEASELVEEASRSIERIRRSAGAPNGAQQFELSDLQAFNSKADPKCLVGNRYFVRGGNCLWAGGAGYGKSSLEIQLAIYFAAGQSIFGLRPVRPLKSLILQAENDLGDTAEQFQGVLAGIKSIGDLDFNATSDLIQKNVGIHRIIGHSGFDFVSIAENIIEIDKPDLVWIDPLFAFAGCDLIDAEKTGRFLREGLFPMADKRGVCLQVIHHVGKPVRDREHADAQSGMSEIDFQYLGFGTSEIQNAFRAVNILLPVAGSPGVYRLVLSKRGERAGARTVGGEWTRSIYMNHSREGICWLQCDEPEARDDKGQFQSKFRIEDVLDQISALEGIKTAKLQKVLADERGMSRATFYRLFEELKSAKKVKMQNGEWIRGRETPQDKPPF